MNEGEPINRRSKFVGEDRLLRKGRNMKGRRQRERGEERGGRGEGELEKEKISMKCEISYECLFHSGIYNSFFPGRHEPLRHASLVQK
jgi:hypothetical protein